MTEEERAQLYRDQQQARYEWARNNVEVTLAGDTELREALEENWEPYRRYNLERDSAGLKDVSATCW